MRRTRGTLAVVLSTVLAAAAGALSGGPAFAADTVEEIHYSYGDTPDSVVLSWLGDETQVFYGPTPEYGQVVLATDSAITPVDRPGPFREARLTGLVPDTEYHYRIGENGDDRTLRAAPAGAFRWVDVGDTASTLCNPWVAGVHQLIASLAPHVVTHGGDITEANDCGVPAVHQYYVDQQVWSASAAFQPAWGNHEYGQPTAQAPPGTPRDSMANYKGRSQITNAGTVSHDSATRTSPPGCAGPLPGNNCRGEDWGWFRAGGVLFIGYPEIWTNALVDWRPAADALMAQAHADPEIDFVVTYGHRPAYSSQANNGWSTAVRTAIDALAARYSPRADNPGGKYVLNVGHHVHALEVFRPINGLTHITNGTGGQGQVNLPTPDPNSILRVRHPGVLSGDYDPQAGTLALSWICGPVYTPSPRDPCEYGQTVYTTTFTAGAVPPPPPPVEWVGNPGVETALTGWTGRYGPSPYVSVARSTADGAHGGVAAIKVQGAAGANNLTSGFNDSPKWVPRSALGVTFTASVWVRPQFVNQQLELRLREWSGGGTLVTDRRTTLQATSTQWQRMQVELTTQRDGGNLAFAVYARDLDAGESFLADDLSLVSN
jgi:hypothetical protein